MTTLTATILICLYLFLGAKFTWTSGMIEPEDVECYGPTVRTILLIAYAAISIPVWIGVKIDNWIMRQ